MQRRHQRGARERRKLSRVYDDRGAALLNKDQLGPAIEDFDEAIGLNLNFAEAFDGRGDADRLGNDPNHAIADYEKAIELKPDDARAFKGRGMVLAEFQPILLRDPGLRPGHR